MKLINLFLIVGLILVLGFLFLSGVKFIINKSSTALSAIEINESPLQEGVIDNSEVCSDSDGGVFFFDKGEVSFDTGFLFFNWKTEVSDKCDGNVLLEYYCSVGGAVNGRVECENGCFDGACL
jgi:hypothetical protein